MNEAGDTSTREPTGSFWKRGDDKPSKVEDAVGVGDRTCRRRPASVAVELTDEKSSEGPAAPFNVVGAV